MLRMIHYLNMHFTIQSVTAMMLLGGIALGKDDVDPNCRDENECAAVRHWADQALGGASTKAASRETPAFTETIPFSFVYDGRLSSKFLHEWESQITNESSDPEQQRRTITWTDRKSGLVVACETRVFSDFPAVEWVLRFQNNSDKDTPILENIQPLDMKIGLDGKEPLLFHHARGSTMTATDYETIDATMQPGQEIAMPPPGIPSQQFLPYFSLQWSDGGVVGAIGWTGQWALSAKRNGQREVSLRAGQQLTHFELLPGESIRTPRILLLRWNGSDSLRGHNLLRRLLLAHYVPRRDGNPALPPVSQNDWFVTNGGNETTEQNQLEIIPRMKSAGMEVYWLDAGWYEGGWPAGNGSWVPKKDHFPRGLAPVGDAAHRAGLKFLLWFEPERVCPNSRIEREHEAWLLPQKSDQAKVAWNGIPGRLFDLGNPEARQWMTNYLSQCIAEWGIDIYRQDRNFHPWCVWRDTDAADRQGIAEIHHVEGLYAMWDELLRRHPRLVIDNANWRCTGPDLEMLMRSAGSWTCSEAENGENSTFNQQQIMGLSLYVPIHASLVFGAEPYTIRSVARLGVGQSSNCRLPEFSASRMTLAAEEIKSLRELYLGDYYPLILSGLNEREWCGWQFDRPDLSKGFAICFRRRQCPYSARDVTLNGLDPSAKYRVSFAESYEIKEERILAGRQLAPLSVEIGGQPGCVLIRYSKLKD